MFWGLKGERKKKITLGAKKFGGRFREAAVRSPFKWPLGTKQRIFPPGSRNMRGFTFMDSTRSSLSVGMRISLIMAVHSILLVVIYV